VESGGKRSAGQRILTTTFLMVYEDDENDEDFMLRNPQRLTIWNWTPSGSLMRWARGEDAVPEATADVFADVRKPRSRR